MDLSFYKGKTVLITGHTGFKGTWMSNVLTYLGANVIGYSLEAPTTPSAYELTHTSDDIISIYGDIRNLNDLKNCLDKYNPEIVFHMAAQPIVRESYSNPVYTYETNVMGTVNILEAIRLCGSVKSVINITTDKVYRNNEWEWGYRECDSLDGYDPYSNSKSCSELVTSSYIKSFFQDREITISTCRAGNVIGGGDFATDRIVPDCVKAGISGEDIILRNPYSTRPYQHVLEPVCCYLYLAMMQFQNYKLQGSYNIGPDDADCITTGILVDLFCKHWGNNLKWSSIAENDAPHEANFLKLDCSKLKTKLGWQPVWNVNMAIKKTVEWSKSYINQENMKEIMIQQIKEYLNIDN